MSYFRPEEWDNLAELSAGIRRAYQKSYDAVKSANWALYRRGYLYMHCMHDPLAFEGAVQAAGRKYTLDSALFRPLFAQQVLTAVPRLKDALKGGEPPFQVAPEVSTARNAAGESDDPHKSIQWVECERYQQWLNFQLMKHIGWGQLLDPLLMEAVPYGSAVLKLDWFQKAEPQWQMQPVPGTQGRSALAPVPAPQVEGLRGQQMWDIVEDRIRAELLSLFHFFPDMRGRSLRGKHDRQPCRYVIETGTANIEELVGTIMSDPTGGWCYPKEDTRDIAAAVQPQPGRPPDLEAMRALERDVREWLKKYEGSGTEQEDQLRKLQTEVKKLGAPSSVADSEDKQVAALMTFWGAGPDPWHIVRIGSETGGDILRKRRREQHPSIFAPLPFIIFKPKGMANELFGLGMIHLLDQLQQEENSWTNLILTAFRESVNGITVMDTSKGAWAERLMGQPNRILEVANPGALPLTDFVHHIERPIPNIGAVLQMLSMIREDGNMAGGATDYLQGGSPQLAGGTVRGYALAVDQGSRRWGGEAENLGHQAGEMGEVMHALNRQHVTRAMHFRALKGEGPAAFKPLAVEMAQQRYEIWFDTRPVVVNEAAELASHVQFVTVNGSADEFNRGEAIVEHAKLLHKSRPERFRVVHPKDADLENEFFAAHGFYPWPGQQHDDHILHDQKHAKMNAWVQGMGPEVQPMLAMQLALHRQSHMAYMGMAVAAGAQPGQPTQVPPPPAQAGAPSQGAPGRPASGPLPYNLGAMVAPRDLRTGGPQGA